MIDVYVECVASFLVFMCTCHSCTWCGVFVGVLCLPRVTDFSTVKNMLVNVVLWGSCHTISRQFVMGDVCRSRNASLSEHRSAYNGVKSVSEPFMSEAGMS